MISVEFTVTVTDTVTGDHDEATATFTVDDSLEGGALERIPGLWSPGDGTPGYRRDRRQPELPDQ